MKSGWMVVCVLAWLLAGCSDSAAPSNDGAIDAGDVGADMADLRDVRDDPPEDERDVREEPDTGDMDARDVPEDVVDEPDIDAAGDSEPDLAPDMAPDTTSSPVYLVHIQNEDDELWLIDVETLEITVACTFEGDITYVSSTFALNGVFYGSRGGQVLDQIDPCTCETTPIGDMGYTGVVGITANGAKGWELYGLTYIDDLLIVMDVADGIGIPVGDGLGVDFGFSGTTWSSEIGNLFAINSRDDMLYHVDAQTGLASDPKALNVNFGSVGIEWHPGDSTLYACTSQNLYRINPDDGATTFLRELDSGCTNLAAPWQPVECLEALLED
jgi:hypothetical protein